MAILGLYIGVLTSAYHREKWELCLEWALVRNGPNFRAKPLLKHLSPLTLLSFPAINTHIFPKLMVTKWENDSLNFLSSSYFFPFLLYFVLLAKKEQNEEKESEANVGKRKTE